MGRHQKANERELEDSQESFSETGEGSTRGDYERAPTSSWASITMHQASTRRFHRIAYFY